MTARIIPCSVDQYHKDPCATPSLSSGCANLILDRSLFHAWASHPRFGGIDQEPTEAMNEGTIVHKLLLGKGPDIVAVDAPDFRTKAAREERDDAIARGKIPVIMHKYSGYLASAARLRDRLASFGYEFKGDSEVAIEFQEGETICRAMLDHMIRTDYGRILIYDIKSTDNASPAVITKRQSWDLSWAVQQHAYTRAVEELYPGARGRIDFTFLVVEREPPYAVVPIKLDGAFQEIGRVRWETAVAQWAGALRNNQWPSYSEGVVTISPTNYVINEQLGDWHQTE